MNIIVCVDNRNGMMFNKRRLSSDALLRQDIFKTINSSELWMSSYSAKQFAKENYKISVHDDFIHMADNDDYCFVENPTDLIGIAIDKIIIYRWNRDYPADLFFDTNISDKRLILTENFAGSSHDKITKEVYE